MIKDIIQFRNELEKVNGWWINKRVGEAEKYPFKRNLFSEIEKEISTRRIICLLGTRRTGKTILLKQLIQSLIKTEPRNVLYYSMDDPSLFVFSDNLLKDLIEYWSENIAGEGKKYVFLDEIHNYPEWHKWIKSYYDRSEIKFFLSGSSSLSLQKEANKFLRGRTTEFELFPLNFNEFLKLSNKKVKIPGDEFEMKKSWRGIKDTFNEYLLVGGFPEWFELKGEEDSVDRWLNRLVLDIPKKAIYEDVAKIFGIKNLNILEAILSFIVANQSRILAYETINDIAKLDRETLINYISFLKNSYLIMEVLKYSKNIKESLKAKKKFLVVDQGLRNALLKDYEVKENNVGFLIENVVGVHIFRMAKRNEAKFFYFRENGEIDFVIKFKGDLIPIEVKYKEHITNSDLRTLLKFVEKNKCKEGIVVTKNLMKEEKVGKCKIKYIPSWVFLLNEVFNKT
ncbi:MAG: ATP-binding protein [Candidatus Aenigmarchaeota archaeon]|nr:ATP-binding protein [Candidatus Aenigmarchaeota archaeon]